MADTPNGTIRQASGGGIVAEHVPLPRSEALVAPTNAEEHNTVRTALIPFACWRANDMRFEFESSFVLPEIQEEIGALKELIDRHTLTDDKGQPRHRPALTVFGHADPTGSDDLNKALSGRRAQVIYGMLIRKVELWEELYSKPLGNDQWEPKAIHRMQATLNRPISDKPSASARKDLFRAYMDHVCTILDDTSGSALDDKGQPVQLELRQTDFLANGADAGGKGDFQGCSEFNPILMFSQKENTRFSDPKHKTERDSENASNRRVVIFLFRPGVRVNPGAWPCPRAKEGVASCKKRFWSDASKRRTFQEERREFKDTRDTFACRFYDRLSNNSPCERELKTFRVRLYDAFGRTIPSAPFSVSIGGRKFTEVSNANPEGIITLLDVQVPDTCVINWGFEPQKDESPELLFSRSIFLVSDSEPSSQAAKKKLHNLGYESSDARVNVTAFQLDFGHLIDPPLDPSGDLDNPTLKLLNQLYQQSLEDLRETDVSGEGS